MKYSTDGMTPDELHEMIIDLYCEKNYNQSHIAQMLGVTQAFVSDYINLFPDMKENHSIRKLNDKLVLKEYVRTTRTQKEAAEILGVRRCTLANYMRRHSYLWEGLDE